MIRRVAVGGFVLSGGLFFACAVFSAAGGAAAPAAVVAAAVAEPGDPCLASVSRVPGAGADGAARAFVSAGWPAGELRTVLMVAGAESSYDAAARNTTADGADYVGLLQISSVHAAVIARHGGDRTDPGANAAMGLDVWRAEGWGAWEAYTSGAYLRFAEQADGALARLRVGAAHDEAAPCAGLPLPGGKWTGVDHIGWASGATAARRALTFVGSTVNPVQGGDWRNDCANFVAQAYGRDNYGLSYAIDGFNAWEHHADRNPPVGALLYWRTSNPARHVAIYIGGGMAVGTDYPAVGAVGEFPVGALEAAGWGPYIGWAKPAWA